MSKAISRSVFRKINLLSIISLFVLILAGGVVRSTGAGMGCPDWPKCFGQYVPPTSVLGLPADYKQKYVKGRLVKNLRFAKTLDLFGYSDLARRIRNDKSILIPEEFNAAKTWTEYINRLIGALSGLFLLAATIYSFSYRGVNNLVPFLSVFNLLLIFLQAWLGSLVVSTNLVAWVITVHLLLALAILAISIATWHLAEVQGKFKVRVSPLTRIVLLVVLLLSIVQITFGAEVRERIDAIAGRLEEGYRGNWVNNAGAVFFQHRNLAILVLFGNVVLYTFIRRAFGAHSIQQQLMSFIFVVLVLQIATGILLSYLSLPPFAQAMHILFASLLFGSQFYLLLNLYNTVNRQGALQ